MRRPIDPAGSPRRAGFSLVELLVILTIVAVLAAVAIPQLLGALEKRRTALCDNLYVALNGDVANELDALSAGKPEPRCPRARTRDDIIDCMVTLYANERNPRNRQQPAYTSDPTGTSADSCQVMLVPRVTSTGLEYIGFQQYVRAESATSRTFSLDFD